MKKLLKKIAIGAGIGVLVAVTLSLFMNFILNKLWVNLENKTYDLRYQLRYPRVVASEGTGIEGVNLVNMIEDIVIVNIDERSMLADKLGVYYKWPRSYHGDVIEYLQSGNNAVTVFDIQFNDADYGSKESQRIMRILEGDRGRLSLKKNELRRVERIIKKGVNYDRSFVEQTKKAGNGSACDRFCPWECGWACQKRPGYLFLSHRGPPSDNSKAL